MRSSQLELPSLETHVAIDALDFFSESDGEARGEVFTRTEVVEFILDLMDWHADKDLGTYRLLEPSCGEGDFLIPAVTRLLQSQRPHDLAALSNCIVGVEVNRIAVEVCRRRVIETLEAFQFSPKDSDWLSQQWIRHADFLTIPLDANFTHVIGNPPYLRQEALPSELLKLYRDMYSTMYDRADLYVPFFEKSLRLLDAEGLHGFICSDRWMKNKYGGPLRAMIAKSFHLDAYIDFTGTDAFKDQVVAYPAVTIIRRGQGRETAAAIRPKVAKPSLKRLAKAIECKKVNGDVVRTTAVAVGAEPWLLENMPLIAEIRKLEQRLPVLEDTGCKVGIGVATGADKIYINRSEELAIEEELMIPLLTTRDVADGKINWTNRYVVNPFKKGSTQLVDPENYPLFKVFLKKHEEALRKRHVAKKNPKSWFKTIDRIYPELTFTPKLMIPDIKGSAEIIYDEGNFYPHHNFYYLTAQEWDLRALKAVMLSPIAKAFISTYSLKMRGDCLRFQAQYLRRIRLPAWKSIPAKTRQQLITESKKEDYTACNETIRIVYGIDKVAWKIFTTA